MMAELPKKKKSYVQSDFFPVDFDSLLWNLESGIQSEF